MDAHCGTPTPGLIIKFLERLVIAGCPNDCPGTTCDAFRHETARIARMALNCDWAQVAMVLQEPYKAGTIPPRSPHQGVVSDSPLMDAKGTGGSTLRAFLCDTLTRPPRGVVVGVVAHSGHRFLDYFSEPTRERPDMQWEDLQWFGHSLTTQAEYGMVRRLEDQAEKLGYELVKKGGEK